MRILTTILLLAMITGNSLGGQIDQGTVRLLKPDRVFDATSEQAHQGWCVLLAGDRIQAVGPINELNVPEAAQVIDLSGTTLLPGLIDAHTHVMLHPYDEASWNDQVLKEPLALRVARATNHLEATVQSGFTTIRDLGTEGAGYADVGLKMAVAEGIIPGPRMIVTTRAIAATGSYGPKGFAPELTIPQGVEEADDTTLVRVVRDQIGRGADWIKVYTDAAMGGQEPQPTFTLEELQTIVETASTNGVSVAAHAISKNAMKLAAHAGVQTIEHGYSGDLETFRLMRSKGVVLCPTLAAAEAMAIYSGWTPGTTPIPDGLNNSRNSFQAALEVGVTIINGSDMGVFQHGDGARELELMVDYGMSPPQALLAATATAAKVLHLDNQLGTIEPGKQADLVAFDGDPTKDIGALRNVRLVVKAGIPVEMNSK